MSKLLLVQILRALAALSVAMLHAQHDAGTLADRSGLGYSHIAFEVADLAAVRASAGRIGLPLTDGALMDGAASLLGHDPDGNVIAFVAPQDGRAPSIADFPDPGIVLRVEAARNGAAA